MKNLITDRVRFRVAFFGRYRKSPLPPYPQGKRSDLFCGKAPLKTKYFVFFLLRFLLEKRKRPIEIFPYLSPDRKENAARQTVFAHLRRNARHGNFCAHTKGFCEIILKSNRIFTPQLSWKSSWGRSLNRPFPRKTDTVIKKGARNN